MTAPIARPSNRDMVGLLVRVDGRCRIELGFATHDAVVFWPDAVERIFADEWGHLIAHLLEQQGAAS